MSLGATVGTRRRGAVRLRRVVRWVLGLALVYAFVRGAEGALRPLPAGLNVDSASFPVDEATFLADTTGVDWVAQSPSTGDLSPTVVLDDGRARVVDQHIFDAAYSLIDGARHGVLIDLFLYNRWQGAKPERTRALTEQLTEHLVAKKRALPDVDVVVITDPINTVYGSVSSPDLDALRAAGVTVVVTDLTRLPDSNPLWSGPWRAFVQPFGRRGAGWLPNPFAPSGPRVTARAWLELFNFKANHRKVIVADTAEGPAAIVTSANPHDGSSAHGNVALRVRGPVVGAIVESERAVAAMSGVALSAMPWAMASAPVLALTSSTVRPPKDVSVRLVTERAILDAVVNALDAAQKGDRIDIAMFYLSERGIIAAIKAAGDRGAAVRLLLDPNKDAFGRTKNGVPNRPVAAELNGRPGIEVRWCDTHGEQCHAKMVVVRPAAGAEIPSGRATLILGSANLTRRNIDGLNLETDLVVFAPAASAVIGGAASYFARVWVNTPESKYSSGYDAYAEDGWGKRLLYRFMEATGMSTF